MTRNFWTELNNYEFLFIRTNFLAKMEHTLVLYYVMSQIHKGWPDLQTQGKLTLLGTIARDLRKGRRKNGTSYRISSGAL